MVKVLFVCLGNICRSPMAEGIFQMLIDEGGFNDKISCDSAGTSGWHIGELPDLRMRETARSFGIELTHEGRKFTTADVEDFDYILAMDSSNMKNIQSLADTCVDAKCKIYMMREFDSVGASREVPDPYYGGAEGFTEVYNLLDRSCRNLLNHIVKENNL